MRVLNLLLGMTDKIAGTVADKLLVPRHESGRGCYCVWVCFPIVSKTMRRLKST